MRRADDIRLTRDAVFCLAKESPTALAVLCRVLWRGRHGECWASVSTLGTDGAPLSARSVSGALQFLVDAGYLTRLDRKQATLFYRAGSLCPAKPLDSVFVPPAVWRTLKPAQLAYWCVRAAHGRGDASRCLLGAVETARMVRSARGTTSRATAYRLHGALVAAGLLSVSQPMATVSKPTVRKSQTVAPNTEEAIRKSNTERKNSVGNTHSAGDAWPQGSFLAPLHGPEGERMNNGWEGARAPRGGDLSSQTSKAHGRVRGHGAELCRQVGNRVDSGGRHNPNGADCAVSQGRQATAGNPPDSAAHVSGTLPARGRADFLAVWSELRRRAGKQLGLRETILSTGLPSAEEGFVFSAFRELTDADTHALPLIGDWIAADGLRWHLDKGMSPWRYLARNLADCLARAHAWDAQGRPSIGRGRTGAAHDEDYELTERLTRKLVGGAK